MKIMLPIFSGIATGIIGNLADPRISNVGLIMVIASGIIGIMIYQEVSQNLSKRR